MAPGGSGPARGDRRERRSAADGAGRRRAFEHGFGHEVVGEGPCLAGRGVEAVAEDGGERAEEGGADGLVVAGPYPVAGVPGTEGAGGGEECVEAGHGPRGRRKVVGAPDL